MPRKKNKKKKKKSGLSVSSDTAAAPRVQLDNDIDAILKQHGWSNENDPSSQKRAPAESSKAKADARVPHTFSQLRLEAIFYPKFENEHQTDSDIRQIMLDRVANGQGYLEASLKQSGSLLLWSGGQRFYSKNATHNQFTAVGEILLRQHFIRAWWNERCEASETHYHECSRYLEQHRLTLAFEVITAVLGDHGATPNRDFVILTAVGDRANERFYSTTELMELAHRFRLPHNDSWVFTKPNSAQSLFDLYDQKRETGLASDIVESLSQTADAAVCSMYPHAVFQGGILEGFVARYVPCPDRKEAQARIQQLSTASQEIMTQVPVHRPDCWELVKDMPNASPALKTHVRAFFHETRLSDAGSFETALQEVLTTTDGSRRSVNRIQKSSNINIPSLTGPLLQSNDKETRRIAALIRALKGLHKPIQYSVIQETTDAVRWLVIIHVLHDTTFQKYYNRMDETDMQLFRGFVVELCENKDSTTSINDSETEGLTCDNDPISHETASFQEIANRQDETLMLKMKLLPYMVRTFGCRNGLGVLKNQGIEGFVKYTKNLLTKWGISPTGRYRWNPFFKAWAHYAQERLWRQLPGEKDLPQLTSWCYLTHLERFSAQFYSGNNKVQTDNEFEESSESSSNGEQQMGIIVFVPGVVGCGKSSLFGSKTASELKDRLPSGRDLTIRMGDLTKGPYWAQVKKELHPQSLYLADKNVPGSQSWGYVADVCATTSTLGVPLVPDAAALSTTRVSGMRLPNGDFVADRVHVYPFSLRYLAVCMARVLQRPPRSHPGKLDSATTRASFVVIKFFSLYRRISADAFFKTMRHKFQSRAAKLAWTPIQVPFFKENAQSLPRDLMETLMDALQVQYGYDLSRKEVQSASDSYITALDIRLQKCIEKHKDLLASMTVDEATSRQAAVDQILARVQELDSMKSDLFHDDEQQNGAFVEKEEPTGRSIRLAALSVSVNDVHAVLLRQCRENNSKKSPLQSFQTTVLQKNEPGKILTGSHCPDRRFIPNTHVTLAHHKSVPQQVLQEMYGPWQGRQVQVQPIALLWSDSVAALEVVLSSSDGNVPEPMNEFVHVTVWCQEGSLAVEANELPDQLAQGSAQRFDLTDAALISGTVKLWK